jgi:multicomponent Na+:H+ antiporter subunit E
MRTFVANLFLAAAWGLFFGGITWTTMISGFVVGFAILWLIQPLAAVRSPYFLRVWYWLKLAVLFIYELVVSSLEVVWDIVTPAHRARPAILEMPLDVKTETGILLVTNLISLTPGTLSIDVSEDRKSLQIHAMFAEDPEAVCRALKSGMEKWVIDAVEER